MSYSFVLGSGFGAIATNSLGIHSLTATAKSAATATATAAANQVIDCKESRVTKVGWVDDTIEDCCEKIKHGSGSFGQKTKGVAQCIARNLSRAGGAALGTAAASAACAATVIGASIAVFCGMVGGIIGGAVGGFIYDRVSGYSSAQITGGLVAGAICTAVSGPGGVLCGVAVAELIGWLSDSVGPVIEGIFDPGAAKRRELAARDAYHKAIEANEKACKEADEKYRLAWGLGVHSLKELYRKAFTTADLQARAKGILGFSDVYDGIARAMRDAGAASIQYAYAAKGSHGCWDAVTSDQWQKENVAKYQAMECSNCADADFIQVSKSTSDNPWDGVVAAWTVEGPAPWSDICPFSVCKFYWDEREKALGKSPNRDTVTAWEKQFSPDIKDMAERIYPAMVAAIAHVATQITTVAVALKQQEIIQATHTATRASLATRIVAAASKAEAAADAAKKGGAEEGKRSVVRANQQYDIAAATYGKLIQDEFGGIPTSSGAAAGQAMACAQDVNCRKASAGIARALAAKKNAPIFAEQAAHKRLLVGSALLAGVAGVTYLAVRK